MKFGIKMNGYHIPVLLNEVVKILDPKPGKRFVDCTLGGGGHAEALLAGGAEVLAIDRDPEAIQNSKGKSQKLILRHGNFENLIEIVREVGWDKVDGVLMDLGVSSHQLETDYRGFSFNKNAQLDMRMDPTAQIPTARDLINVLNEGELAELFWKYGEDRYSKQIAKEIKRSNIETTDDLAKAILRVRHDRGRTHPATRVFQALRMAVNDELNSLKSALPQAWEILKPEGVLAVISFHSLEDRIVKNFMNNNQKPIISTKDEVEFNPRARSGKLRFARRQ